jgi:hypothetical protein
MLQTNPIGHVDLPPHIRLSYSKINLAVKVDVFWMSDGGNCSLAS